MTHSFKLSRRIARLRAPLLAALVLAIAACNSTDSFTPGSAADPDATDGVGVEAIDVTNGVSMASTSFAGGIPFGLSAQPTTAFGGPYNGALRNIWPGGLLGHLAAIKARGGKVVLMFAGNQRHYRDGAGHFSMTKWKARIDRFKKVNFTSYINDGTIIGHFILDEPNDPSNWSGRMVTPAVVEEMARYSKATWPNMATIVRAEPYYFNFNHRYLDATWAQYVTRKGPVDAYLRKHVADAQKRGLGLVVGLNVTAGGTNRARLTATQIRTYGAAMLSSTYPCAFISWQYSSMYSANNSLRDAMAWLRGKAQNRPAKSCRS